MEVYYLHEWIIITLDVAGFLHPAIFQYLNHNSDKSGLKVADCTVQSAKYWCFYGTVWKSSSQEIRAFKDVWGKNRGMDIDAHTPLNAPSVWLLCVHKPNIQ